MKPPERANAMIGMDFVMWFDAVQKRALFWTALNEFDTEEGQKRLIKIELKRWWLVFCTKWPKPIHSSIDMHWKNWKYKDSLFNWLFFFWEMLNFRLQSWVS